ncbi:mycofactocin precursor MftA [Streptomyces sp. NPDC056910]|uniref:Mycofactocin MftA n=1 Tax=Streptomyces aureus TaxID=193461 RepID=A0ABV4SZ49_9ACTN|nr:mycofactocin precursor MftA [Streptomyces sp. CB01635]PJN05494.1 mycofactocin precursor [Streptomyces sp. CB01635]
MNEFDTVPADEQVTEVAADTLVETDALIEEVSIDGMCGVY